MQGRIGWLLFAAVVSIGLAGCTLGKAVKPDVKTGYIVSGKGAPKKADVVLSKKADMASLKPLALVTGGHFAKAQIQSLDYFGEVIDLEELRHRIVMNNLREKVPSVSDRIGLSNAAHNYRPFLWIHYMPEVRGNKEYGRLIATDPMSSEDLFIAEKELDYVWKGVNDQNTFYPMFNSLIEWLKNNES